MTTSTPVERRCRFARRALLSMTTILCSGLAAPAFAQSAPIASEFQTIDGNGVDMVTGGFNYTIPLGSIGSSEASLSMVYGVSDFENGVPGLLNFSGYTPNKIGLTFGTDAENFTLQSGIWVSREGSGATINGGGDSYTYTSSDGTMIVYGRPNSAAFGGQNNSGIALCGGAEAYDCKLLPLTKTLPNGRTQHYHWTLASISGNEFDPDTGEVPTTYFPRLSSIVNESGYILKIKYATDSYSGAGPSPEWFKRVSVKFINQTKEYCDPEAANCDALVQSWPTATLSYPSSGVTQITDISGGVWRVTSGSGTFAIKRPGSSADTTSVTNPGGIVTSITTNGVTSNYSRSVSAGVITTVRTNALSKQTTVKTRSAEGRPYEVTNEAGATTSYTYDSSSRPTEIADPEGIKRQFAYDARGNIITTTVKAKPGSGLANLVTSTDYDAACANGVKCNQPNAARDAKGNETNYSYDSSGMLASIAMPAPTPGASRPTTTLGYSVLTGYGDESVKVVAIISACRTSATCVGTADEARITTGFGSVTANNLQPVSVTRGAGDNSLVVTATSNYDKYGNVVSVDGPLTGTADTTTYRYDAGRRPVGAISADPDGTGALPRRAVRTSYNADGQATAIEAGTVAGTSDADWAAFSSAQTTNAVYDANGRNVRDSIVAGGTTYGVVQYSYDALGRVECAAVRMNSATFGNLPGACTASAAGSSGSDRITRVTGYDNVSRTTEVTSAYGTADASIERTSYTGNGQVEDVTDANGNKTRHVYDGLSRLSEVHLPSPSSAGQFSTTDYQAYEYDPNGNVTTRRTRAGQSFSYSYDALNRVTVEAAPSGSGMRNVYYAYNVLSQPTQARFDSAAGADAVLNDYDALGRIVTSTTSMGGVSRTLAYQHDLQGNQTRLTHPDGVYFDKSYDVLGRFKNAWWTALGVGTVPFVNITYDALGRRADLNRASSFTGYAWDAAGRLGGMNQRFAGNVGNVSTGFSYNPAGQIASQTRDNDDYAYTGSTNVDRSYGVNGLNQATSVAGATLSYDANGNLTSDGTLSYAYDANNRMVSASNGTTLTYDPLGRLWQTASPANGKTQFLYDGGQVAVEHDGDTGTIRRRYMFGPGIDQPILWGEGAAMNCSATRFLHPDQQGSIVAVADCNGNRTAVNSYDEYGNPNPGNQGRFGYTGQGWLPDLSVWYYKARMYAPGLGRFMQTDPIGYGDGLNLYGYVSGDPVNRTDPLGLQSVGCEGGDAADDPACDVVVTASRPSPTVQLSREPGGYYSPTYQNFQPRDPFDGSELINTEAPQSDDIVVTGQRPREDDVSGDIVVTAPRFILAKDNQPRPQGPRGGPDTGCMRMFNACHKRAYSFPDDRDARNAYLECRDALRVCSRIESMPTTDGFVYVRGVGWVWVSGGRSYFLPVPRSWRQP